jgi:hypothetical protein
MGTGPTRIYRHPRQDSQRKAQARRSNNDEALLRTRTVDPLSMKKGRMSTGGVVGRPVRADAAVVGGELGSSLYRLLVGGQG